MNRFSRRLGGLALAGLWAAVIPAQGADELQSKGTGPAYESIGKVAVMHEGRVKPLDTVAREEIKQVYHRETMKLRDLNDEVEAILDPQGHAKKAAAGSRVAKWGPVGAFIGWTLSPEYWDDQPFILVDYLPLRRKIVAETLTSRLNAIAEKSTTADDEKSSLRKLAAGPETTAAELTAFVRGSKLPAEDKKTIAEVAVKLSEEHKWLTPRELEEAKITDKDHTHPFIEWASELQDQQRQFNANPQSAARLTELERRAVEAATRLSTYKAYSGERFQTTALVLIMPRPNNAKYLAATAKTIKEAREKGDPRDLPVFKLDELKAISTYWNNVPRDDRRDPTEDAAFDERYAAWLRDNSVWVPLKVMLRSKPEELVEAGYPEPEVRAFLDAYRELSDAESSSPGQVSEASAAKFLATSRALGEAVNPSKYPTNAKIERETHFNAMNPFWQAPYAYGTAVTLLLLSLGFVSVAGKSSFPALMGSTIYRIGLASLAIGIALEIYGFYLRVRISSWAPVTNMYETVIWVALVAAVLSLVFEMIYRKVFTALAGSAVALLGTIVAANVPLLDPSIRSLQPVLRDNFWLSTHVLCVVSSYAAFGLAWMLGLVATIYYLTATYRRSPRFLELALPLIPGLLLLAGGGAGVAASYGWFGPEWTIGGNQASSSSQSAYGGDTLFYVFASMALLGETISLASLLAIGGEVVNRLRFRPEAETELPEEKHSQVKLDARGRAMQRTAATLKPLSNFIYRAMQVGVLLVAAGTILGGVWADYSWGRFWGWDPKEVWALITLLVYLIPLHGRFAGWVSAFGLVVASVVCFLSVIMAWYGVNFVLGVGLHSYGFVEGGSQGMMSVIIMGVLGLPAAAAWRRFMGQRRVAETVVETDLSPSHESGRSRSETRRPAIPAH
jgi:ABC-type transport system involved in cytochrome c biogenesis permease subunit